MTRRRGYTTVAPCGMGLGFYALLVRGALTVDLGIGRTARALGPITWRIAAPRELVFEVVSSP